MSGANESLVLQREVLCQEKGGTCVAWLKVTRQPDGRLVAMEGRRYGVSSPPEGVASDAHCYTVMSVYHDCIDCIDHTTTIVEVWCDGQMVRRAEEHGQGDPCC
jgi:hypothetical protein